MKNKMFKIIYSSFFIVSIIITAGCNLFKDKNNEKSNLPIESSSKFLEGTITSEATVIETEHFKVEIPKNVYVPGYFKDYLEVIYDALETVSGLTFYNENYNPDKIIIEVEKPVNDNGNEFCESYAYTIGSIIHISSGDLLLGNSETLIHELSHILQYSQSAWIYSDVLSEGFAQYNAYKTIKYLETTNIEVAKTNTMAQSIIGNVSLTGDIYSKSIEYWLGHEQETYDISDNGVYSVGMRFMSYLDYVYGDYSNWFNYYEEINPSYAMLFMSKDVSLIEQLDILNNAYDEDVLDNFYDWLEENENIYFKNPWITETNYDLTDLEKTYIYPHFYKDKISTTMSKFHKFSYNNLYVNISEVRNYLQNYKEKNVTNLKLKLSDRVNVELYNANNELILSKKDDSFSLDKVSYVKLVGQGTLGSLNEQGLKITY